MAAIGDCWATDSWLDDTWADDTWADSGALPFPMVVIASVELIGTYYTSVRLTGTVD